MHRTSQFRSGWCQLVRLLVDYVFTAVVVLLLAWFRLDLGFAAGLGVPMWSGCPSQPLAQGSINIRTDRPGDLLIDPACFLYWGVSVRRLARLVLVPAHKLMACTGFPTWIDLDSDLDSDRISGPNSGPNSGLLCATSQPVHRFPIGSCRGSRPVFRCQPGPTACTKANQQRDVHGTTETGA